MNDSGIEMEQERTGTRAQKAELQVARFLIVALIASLLLFPSLHRPGLAGYDDSYFAHEAKEMVHTGDWWNVRFNGEFILAHPPLFQWMVAASFKLFGINDTAAKLPSALLGFATILLMYPLTLELTGDSWLAPLSMLVLASTQFFLKNATHAMTDVPFTFFFALAIFTYIRGLKQKRYLALMGVPLALAVLTRSVVGLLALGIIVTHLLLIRRYRLLFSPWLIFGVVIAIALPAVWYVSQYRIHGAAFFTSHLEFLSSKIHVESGASRWTTIFNYPLALLKYYWPWLPFLVVGFVMAFRASVRQKEQTSMLLVIWVFLVIVPFSFAATRYPRYIMAVFPAFSVLSAIALNRAIPVVRRKAFFNTACAIGGIAVCLSFLLPPKTRADDIAKLAPVAETGRAPDQRVLMYTYEDGRTDFLYQFVWYSNRYAQLADSLPDLATKLRQANGATAITDKKSYSQLLPLLTGRTPQVLGESENLICFRVP